MNLQVQSDSNDVGLKNEPSEKLSSCTESKYKERAQLFVEKTHKMNYRIQYCSFTEKSPENIFQGHSSSFKTHTCSVYPKLHVY